MGLGTRDSPSMANCGPPDIEIVAVTPARGCKREVFAMVKQEPKHEPSDDTAPAVLLTPAKVKQKRVKQESVRREAVVSAKHWQPEDGDIEVVSMEAAPVAVKAMPPARRRPAKAKPVKQESTDAVHTGIADLTDGGGIGAVSVETAPVTVKAASPANRGAAHGPRARCRKAAAAPAEGGGARRRKTRVRQAAAAPARTGADLRAAVLELGVRVFLEIFSGSKNLTNKMLAVGIPAFGVDILDGFDMLDEDVSNTVFDLLREGLIVGLWLGTPCHGLGRARRGRPWLSRLARGKKSGWPAAIRGPNNVWGLPLDELSPLDAKTLQTSNSLARVSIALFRVCVECGVPVAMENPFRSYLWLMPEVEALWKDVEEAILVPLDFCAYGTPWKKTTRILFHGWIGVGDVVRRCRARRTGKGQPTMCQYSMCAHQHLSGINRETKKWWTSVAEPYPEKLVERIAAIFQNTIGMMP